jgi:hypothetical protein
MYGLLLRVGFNQLLYFLELPKIELHVNVIEPHLEGLLVLPLPEHGWREEGYVNGSLYARGLEELPLRLLLHLDEVVDGFDFIECDGEVGGMHRMLLRLLSVIDGEVGGARFWLQQRSLDLELMLLHQ